MWEVGNMDKNMDNNYIDKISNKEVIRQLIIFAMKHRRIMQKFLDETGVYQAQHRQRTRQRNFLKNQVTCLANWPADHRYMIPQ